MSATGLYGAVTDAIGVIAPWYLRRRARAGKEDPLRLGERFGRTDAIRPTGPLVWLHAASVGESLTLLPVLERLQQRRPDAAILMTTGTVTSARMMAARLPPGVLHQFVPIDTRAAVRRFLDHWRPSLAMIVESELWPNLVLETTGRAVPLVLLNGRLSAGSFRRWHAWPHLGRFLFPRFALVLAQDAVQAERFTALGAGQVAVAGDLKAAVAPPPADLDMLERLRVAIGGRRVWLAASTHPGEETLVIATHQALCRRYPELLTVIAPRHPNRGDAVAEQIAGAGLACRRRSDGELPDATTEIYLVDTLGELGAFYRLAPIVLVGGSLGVGSPVGGHNPLEAAALGCAVLHGPDIVNSAAVTRMLDQAGAAVLVVGRDGLTRAVAALLADPERAAAMGRAGQSVATEEAAAVDRVMTHLDPWLGRL